MDKVQIDKIKQAVMENLNGEAMLKVQKGRGQTKEYPVMIEGVHPNVFTVRVSEKALSEFPGTSRRMSFTYIDLLTGSIELAFA